MALTANPKTTIVTIATGTATRLVSAPSDGTPRANGGVVVKALSTNSAVVYIGESGIDGSASGFPLSASESISLDVDDPSRLYGISGTSSQKVAVLYL